MNRIDQMSLFVRLLIGLISTYGCMAGVRQSSSGATQNALSKQMIVWDSDIEIDSVWVITEEVTIMPQAFVRTTGIGNITFTKKVNILGESQVFDTDIRLAFQTGTINEVYPNWFGAKGYDNLDDTHAFQKAISVARHTQSAIRIFVPLGRYFISETLEVSGLPANKKSISWYGSGMSTSGTQGSSLSWTGLPGQSMMEFRDVDQLHIENLDFTAEPQSLLRSNISFRPFVNQVQIQNCSFKNCAGVESANIDINIGDGDQVSELHFDNCTFHGMPATAALLTGSAIKGGLANTKNFYIENCAFSSYATSAIDINISDILNVEGCTFANNEVDISCMHCGTYAHSNYSEHSMAFFNAGVSSNIAFATLVNNIFVGQCRDGYVIRDGSGSLILMNNDFGGGSQSNEYYRVKWESSAFNSIYSVGNFFKNADQINYPFHNRSGHIHRENVRSIQDIGGTSGLSKKYLND